MFVPLAPLVPSQVWGNISWWKLHLALIFVSAYQSVWGATETTENSRKRGIRQNVTTRHHCISSQMIRKQGFQSRKTNLSFKSGYVHCLCMSADLDEWQGLATWPVCTTDTRDWSYVTKRQLCLQLTGSGTLLFLGVLFAFASCKQRDESCLGSANDL